MRTEIRQHLTDTLIPFWKGLKDDSAGGFYGYVGPDLQIDRGADKGCILMSRIVWFFSNTYLRFGSTDLLDDARHGYLFLKNHCLDAADGGVFWSVHADGSPADTTKHTYNQAFTIYALASYYDASGDREALDTALTLFRIIETRMKDTGGYLEAFDRHFLPASNEKLSENGVMAFRTMNTHLHILEAYTELVRVLAKHPEEEAGRGTDPEDVRRALYEVIGIFTDRIWNPAQKRAEVFFDEKWTPLLDLWSSGHDIETSWLLDRTARVLADAARTPSERARAAACGERIGAITRVMAEEVLQNAFFDGSVISETENGIPKAERTWWVQAEGVVGFMKAYEKDPSRREFLDAACREWQFIKDHFLDPREGSEWFHDLDASFCDDGQPIVEEWKCPYHNGRMCLEVMA